MPYTPITQDQFQSAVSAGFSPEQITKYETLRKRSVNDKEQGTITQHKPDLNDMLGYQQESQGKHPVEDFIGETLQGQFMNRPFGAIRAMTAGKSPIEGFQRPDETPSFKESAGKAWGLNYKDPVQDLAGDLLDVGLSLGTAHLIMGVPIKAAAEGVHNWYYEPLHTMAKNEFKEAGMDEKTAHNAATHIVNSAEKLKFRARNPEALQALKENLRGKLGTSLKQYTAAAEDVGAKTGINPKLLMNPKAQKLLTLKTAGEPQTDFGKQLKTDIENRPPFTPAEYMGGKKAVVPTVIPPIKPVVSKGETTKSSEKWYTSEYRRLAVENKVPKHPFIDVDLDNPSVQHAIQVDPSLTQAQKNAILQNRILGKQQPTQPPTTIQPSVGKPAVASGKPATAAVVSPSVNTDASQLRPAIKVKEGEYKIGKYGEHHDDIVVRNPSLKNKQRGFVDQNGKWLTREQGAKLVGQKEPLHSEDLPQTKPARIDKIKQIAQKHASKKTMTFVDKGVTDKIQPLSPNVQPVNILHNVHIETPTGDKMMTMNTKQLMDFQDSLKEENKLGIKIKDIQPLSSDDPKFKAYQDQIKKINDMRKKCQD